MKFGETVEGYNIPVLNEREVRASAGILFMMLMIAIMSAILKQDFLLLKYFIVIFLVDFTVRLIISPKYAPTLVIGRMIVRRQNPEYVGAAQKKFAWVIGISLAVIMFVLSIVMNSFSPITGIICLICTVFLLFESAFGICLGCLFYKWIKKEKAQYCPGEICEVKSRQDIQRVSGVQVLMVIGFIVLIVLAAYFFNDAFKIPSHPLWDFGAPGK
ncbi:MAG: DUF4395 domain-containing protein [Ignavibacteriae bacterium]|nr:DUF4395 domain-containing protein [Ignavibacteriota bacterium]